MKFIDVFLEAIEKFDAYKFKISESLPPGFNADDVMSLKQFVSKGKKDEKLEEDDDSDEDAQTRPLSKKELKGIQKYKSEKDPKKRDDSIDKEAEGLADKPSKMIHRSTIIDKDTGKPIPEKELKAKITQRPTTLISQNSKMKKSGGDKYEYYDISLPSYQGLYVDEKTGEIKIVKTCSKAKECVKFCYASKGSFIQYEDSGLKQARIVNYYMNDYEGFSKQLDKEIKEKAKGLEKKGKKLAFRWHDSGDFISDKYLTMALRIARQNPSVHFYAYTKEVSRVKKMQERAPTNFTFVFSFGGKEDAEIGNEDKYSNVVPKELFDDLFDKKSKTISPENIEILKKRVSKELNLPLKSIITYDELMDRKVGETNQYNVLVWAGHGDDAAPRPDVQGVLLLAH